MSAVLGRCAVPPHVVPETMPEPRRPGRSLLAGRRRLTAVLATTTVALALALGGAPGASAAGPDPVAPTTTDVARDEPAPEPTRTTPTKEFVVDRNATRHARSISSKKVRVLENDELLVAFVSVNGPADKAQSVTEVTGGGLSWNLVERGNARVGTSEVWQAYATQPPAAFRVKARFARSGYSSKITVAGFTDASTAGGATAHASGTRSAPAVTLVPQHTGSLVWAAGRVVGERYDPRPGTGTRIVHDVGISHPRVGYWVQKASAPTVVGQRVTIAADVSTRHPWGLTAIEIQGVVYL